MAFTNAERRVPRRARAVVSCAMMLAAFVVMASPSEAIPTRCTGTGTYTNTISPGGVEKPFTTTCDNDSQYYYRLHDTSSNGICIRADHFNPTGGHTSCATSGVDVVYFGDSSSTIRVCDIASNGTRTNCSGTLSNVHY